MTTSSDISNSALDLLNLESSLPESTQVCQDLSKTTQVCQDLSKTTQVCQELSKPKHVGFLSEKNQNDIAKRGLLNNWARSTCRTVTGEEASLYLGCKAKSGGILFTGQNGQYQFLPDKAWKNEGEKKPPKYRSPLGEFDAFVPPSPDDPLFWEIENLKRDAFYINDHPYILITEGIFKAIAGCSNGIPTIALLGVEQGLTGKAGDVEGKRFLVPSLRLLAEAGFGFIIAFDADALTNPNICTAQKKLAKQLVKFKVPVRIITGAWPERSALKDGEVKNTKGMDDFIQHKGIEEFREKLAKSKLFDENESEPDGDSEDFVKKKKQLPPPSAIAAELAEIYREKLAWESEYQLWRHYGAKYDGLWDVETVETVKGLIHAHLRSQDLPGFTAGYVSSIATILQSDLEVINWDEQTGLIPLRDGVLNQVTKELKSHAPGYRFTWQLPHRWADSHIGCQPIEDFLLKVTGCQAIVNVLLAFLSAVVTRRADLQRYLELIGGGGTGKSTVMALARALAGDANTASSQLQHLETNQFETAKFYGKTLAIFPDSERWQGEVGNLKRLTGQDPIRYERKKVQQCKDYIFGGMVILSANEPIESKDKTSGLKRRQLTIPFDIRVPEYKNRNLKKEFEPYIPGLLKRVLDISPEEVTRLVGDTDEQVPELAGKKWEQMYQTNDIARWLDDKVVLSPELKTYVGTNDEAKRSSWLYANYCADRLEQNEKPISMKAFRPNLMDLLLNQLKVQVEAGEDRQGRFIKGVGLRCQHDPTGEIYPRPVTKNRYGGGGLVADGGGCVVAESIGSGGWDGCNGLTEGLSDTEKFQQKTPSITTKNQNCDGDGRNNRQHPPNPPLPSIPATTRPPQSPQNPSHPPEASPPASKFKVGDQVQIRSDYLTPELRGQQAVVVKDYEDGVYRIDFGREIKVEYMKPKQEWDMNKQYFHLVEKDESDLPISF